MKTEIILGGFRKRKLPINADYRPLYKISIIILILKLVCNGNKSSLSKMHFFIWALKSKKHMDFISEIINTNKTDLIMSWGVEPALNKALLFGIGEGVFEFNGDKYKLTEKGNAFYIKIKKAGNIFTDEIHFLESLGKQKISEALLETLTQSFNKKKYD